MAFKLVGIGEVLWDLLPAGPQLGGAPANFTCHACALGAAASLISRVGNDDLGRTALKRLAALGIPLEAVEVDPDRPTGTVGVDLRADGQPQFHIHENVAWDSLSGSPAATAAVRTADAICFGTLAQRSENSRATIRALVQATPSTALRILDINLRPPYVSVDVSRESLELANALKVNDTELPWLASALACHGDMRSQIVQIAERYKLRLVAYTRGSQGSLLYADGLWSDHLGVKTEVVDAVGAGDAFTAAMALGHLAGWNLDRINALANQVASFVCSHAGATPALPASLRAQLST